jgi:hypothetical protein
MLQLQLPDRQLDCTRLVRFPPTLSPQGSRSTAGGITLTVPRGLALKA